MKKRSSSSMHGLRKINSKIRRRLINSILERDKVCVYCGSEVFLNIDHVIPIAMGGSNDEDNLVACCEGCNQTKSKYLPSEIDMPIKFGGLTNKRKNTLSKMRV